MRWSPGWQHEIIVITARDSVFPLLMPNTTEQTMPEDVPLSGTSAGSPKFLIGKDSHGRWVAQDQRGLCGGLFISRAEAMRFAMFENGRRPQAVIMVHGTIELDMTRRVETVEQQTQCRAA
jgi:hypothetical protein